MTVDHSWRGGALTLSDLLTASHELVHVAEYSKESECVARFGRTFVKEATAEFVGRRALLRAGLLTVREWSQLVSGKFYQHRERVEASMHDEPDRPTDGYILGDLILLMVDAEIQRLSYGSSDIRVLLPRLREFSGQPTTIHKEFIRAVRSVTSERFASRIDAVLRVHAAPSLAVGALAECFVVRQHGSAPWEWEEIDEVNDSSRCRAVLQGR